MVAVPSSRFGPVAAGVIAQMFREPLSSLAPIQSASAVSVNLCRSTSFTRHVTRVIGQGHQGGVENYDICSIREQASVDAH